MNIKFWAWYASRRPKLKINEKLKRNGLENELGKIVGDRNYVVFNPVDPIEPRGCQINTYI